MPTERWGSLSVADHIQTRALALSVLLYDRLIVPVATSHTRRNEFDYWRAKGWAPDLQHRCLDHLDDLAARPPLDETRREQFSIRASLGDHPKSGHSRSPENRPPGGAGTVVLYCASAVRGKFVCAPASRTALQYVCVVEQPVEEGRHRRRVAEQLAPVLDGAVRRDEGGDALVAAHDELEEVFGRGSRELAHTEVVDDEQRHGGELGHDLLAALVERGIGELVEKRMRLAVAHSMALLDGREGERLCEVTLAGAGRSEEENVLATLDGECQDRCRLVLRDR
jgi:hypothetical protein